MKRVLFFWVICTMSITVKSQTLIGNSISGNFGEELSLDIGIRENDNQLLFGGPDYLSYNGIMKEYSLATNWYVTDVINNDPVTSSRFGTSLSLSSNGNRIAVGAPYHFYSVPYDIGKVYIYDYNANVTPHWQQVGNVIQGVSVKDLFGEKITLSSDGSRLAISGYRAEMNGIADAGLVRVYQLNTNNNQWEQLGTDFFDNQTGTDFGRRSCVLSKDGNTLVIGVPGKLNNNGVVKIFKWNQNVSAWEQVGSTLSGSNAERFGTSVVVNQDGTLLSVGCASTNSYQGRVRTFRLISGTWVEFSSSLLGEATDNYFGSNISISDNGTVLAVSALGWGNFKGKVYVYSLVSDNWVLKTSFDGLSNSRLGTALSLTSNGEKIAIGSKPNGAYRVSYYDISNALNGVDFVTENTKVYPNPAYEVINISLSNSLEFIRARIYSSMGKLVNEYDSKEIKIQNLPQGLYFLEVETNSGRGVKQFLKE